MVLSSTFYVATPENEGIPPQYEWHQGIDDANSDAIECAETHSETFIVYEITIRPICRTKTTVELENI